MNCKKIIAFILYIACVIVGTIKFGWAGALLVMATATTVMIYCADDDVYEDEDEPEHDSCEGCRNYLGGGCCRLNLEDECAAGGGFELWEDD